MERTRHCIPKDLRTRKIGLISGHITHHFTIEQNWALSKWAATTAFRTPHLLLGIDASETCLQPGHLLEAVTLSCTGRGEAILQWALDHRVVLPPQEMDLPTHFPYAPSLKPRRLDYLAIRGIFSLTPPWAILGTWCYRTMNRSWPRWNPIPPGSRIKTTVQWGPRELRRDYADLLQPHKKSRSTDAHVAVAAMAKEITQPMSCRKFKESRALKDLRRRAQLAAPGAAARDLWKQVTTQLKKERKAWQNDLAASAGGHDWQATSRTRRSRARNLIGRRRSYR